MQPLKKNIFVILRLTATVTPELPQINMFLRLLVKLLVKIFSIQLTLTKKIFNGFNRNLLENNLIF